MGRSDPASSDPAGQSDKESARVPEEMLEGLLTLLGDGAVRIGSGAPDPYWVPGDGTYAASGTVFPNSVDEVQGIVRLANRFGVTLWPYGQGRNLGFGGPSPRKRGSLQVSFQRMNRILEINEELAYAVVEPGVRWSDLHEALQRGGHRLVTPTPDLGWGSIIGNWMDAGITYQHYGADHQIAAGIELVLPQGDVVRTRMGAMSENPAWHLYQRGQGPDISGLLPQSSLGIVTRMGVRLKPQPEVFAPVMLTVGSEGDLPKAIDALREMLLNGVLDGVPAVYRGIGAAVMLRDAPTPDPRETMTFAGMQAIVGDAEVGSWAVRTGVSGYAEVVDARLSLLRMRWSRLPTGRVVSRGRYSPEEYDDLQYSAERIVAGVPGLTTVENMPDHVGHLAYSPVVPLRGSDIRALLGHVQAIAEREGIRPTFGLLVPTERAAIAVIGVQYDRTDAVAVADAVRFTHRLAEDLGSRGYGEYRSHIDLMDRSSDLFDFNDHALKRVQTILKDALDPRGILSPGRYGVWPGGGSDSAR